MKKQKKPTRLETAEKRLKMAEELLQKVNKRWDRAGTMQNHIAAHVEVEEVKLIEAFYSDQYYSLYISSLCNQVYNNLKEGMRPTPAERLIKTLNNRPKAPDEAIKTFDEKTKIEELKDEVQRQTNELLKEQILILVCDWLNIDLFADDDEEDDDEEEDDELCPVDDIPPGFHNQ